VPGQLHRSDPSAAIRLTIRALALVAALTVPQVPSPAAAGLPAPPKAAHPSPLTPVAVFGTDDRIELAPESHAAAGSVGLLVDLDRKTVCTAFCIAESTVMTAAHCLYPAGRRAAPRFGAFRFRSSLAASRGEARIASRAHTRSGGDGRAAAPVATGATRLSLRPPIDAVDDWAVLRLDRNVCPSGGLRLSRRPTEDILALARRGRLYSIGFHRDFENFARAMAPACDAARSFGSAGWDAIARDFRRPDDLVLHTCDTGGSSSGAPLLVDGPDGPEVVGINVGTYLHAAPATPTTGPATAAAARPSTREIANTAIAAHAIAGAAEAFMVGDLLVAGAEIRALKSALAARGLLEWPRDDAPDERLRAAIEAYEAAQGLAVTGLPTRRLLARLRDGTADRTRFVPEWR
jgi:protease YdgD